MSVNEMATQNIRQHHFPKPGQEGRGPCGTNWPTEVEEIQHFMNLMIMIDSSLPPVAVYGSHSQTFLKHISPKKGHKGWLLKKKA
jgi:hypothetical protein